MTLRTIIASAAILLSATLGRAQEIDIMGIAQLVSEEQYAIAMDSLLVMSQRDSLDDAVWYYRGVCEGELGRLDDACESFRKALSIDPYNEDYRSPYILTMLADDELYEFHNDSLAHAYYTEAVRKDDSYAPAMLGLAEADRMSGNTVAYFADIEPFLRLEYVNPEMKCNYMRKVIERIDGATYRIYHNQFDGMVEAVVQTHPADSSALILGGSWFYSTDRKEKGRHYFQQWRDTDPSNPSAQTTCLSIILQMDGRPAAIDSCDAAIAAMTNPKDKCQLIETKATLLHEEGRVKESYKLFEQAVKLDPDNLSLLNNYAYFLSLTGKQLRKAEKMSRKTIVAEPDNASYLDTYGWILHLMGRDKDAKIYFKRCMIHGGKEKADVLFHYYRVLESLGEHDLARYYKGLYESKSK